MEYGLRDVDELGRLFAEDVRAEELAIGLPEHELEQPIGRPRDPRPRVAGEPRAPDSDVVALGARLLLGEADHRDLGQRVDAGRQSGIERVLEGDPERPAHGHAGLLHRHRRQSGRAHDVPGRVDPRGRRTESLVDDDASARADLDTDLGETETLDVALTTERVEHRAGAQLLAVDAYEQPAVVASDLGGRSAEHESRTRTPEALGELGGDVGVDDRQEPRAAIDEGHGDAERGEDRGVLGAHRAAADDNQAARQRLEVEDRLAVVDIGVVERHLGRMVRTRSRREEHVRGAHRALRAVGERDRHRAVRAEPRDAVNHLDAMAFKVSADRCGERGHDIAHVCAQTIHHELGRQRDADPEDIAPRPPGEVHRGVAQSLDRHALDGDRRPSLGRTAFDDGDAVPVVGRLRGALLPRRPRADHDEVERVGLRDRAQVDLARHVDVGVRQIGAQVELHADPLPRRHPRCPARRLAPERSRRTRADA